MQEDARLDGEMKARVVDLELRLAESLDRERRLGERLYALDGETASRERDLREKLQGQLDFYAKVVESRSWRVLQLLRGLVGRKW